MGSLLRSLARPAWFFYALIWLMILLASGTIAEKYVGLYAAQKTFFSSFVIWLGGIIPAPGGYTVLALVFVNLLLKLVTEKWTKAKTGTLITHSGAVLLLFGGFLTTAFSSEGSMVINPGDAVNFVEDYHRNELAVTDAAGKSIVFRQDRLQSGGDLTAAALPFAIKVESLCSHCQLRPRKQVITDGSAHGMLAAVDMSDAPLSPVDEQNIPGIIFSVGGAGKDINGRYALFEDMPIDQHIEAGGVKYQLALRRERTLLPFAVKLIHFEKQMYPGTDKARGYQSEVAVEDNGVEWRGVISMNHPLRYKGYTFYQSSFIDKDRGEATVLAVVKNSGAIFPYISSLTLCVGFLVHLFLRLPKLRPKVGIST